MGLTETDHLMLFTGDMVRAILDGTKTVTRRVVTDHTSQGNFRASEMLLNHPDVFVDPGPSPAGNPGPYLKAPLDCPKVERRRGWKPGGCDPHVIERLYPRIFPGDRLWVREEWATVSRYDDLPPREINPGAFTYHRAAGPGDHPITAPDMRGRWRRSIHMPRWACRVTLEVTEVRVERLHEITEDEARAEGVSDGGCLSCGMPEPCGCDDPRPDARDSFAFLWDSINGKRAPWSDNPWVWCVRFRRAVP